MLCVAAALCGLTRRQTIRLPLLAEVFVVATATVCLLPRPLYRHPDHIFHTVVCPLVVCVVLAKGGVRVAYTEQLSQFGDAEGVDPGAVDRWLSASGTLQFDPPNTDALQEGNEAVRGQDRAGDEDDEDDGAVEARYNCGLDSCYKTFKHDHFLAAGGGGLPAGFGEGGV